MACFCRPTRTIAFLYFCFTLGLCSFSGECPTSISFTTPWLLNSSNLLDTKHETLKSCHNINSLELRLHRRRHSENSYHILPIDISGGDRYPPLKRLRVDNYYFSRRYLDQPLLMPDNELFTTMHSSHYKQLERKDPKTRKEWLKIKHSIAVNGSVELFQRGRWAPGWPDEDSLWDWCEIYNSPQRCADYEALNKTQRDKTNLDLWLDAMDWNKLVHLAVGYWYSLADRYETLDKLAPYMQSLESFETHDSDSDTVGDFLGKLRRNSLKSLVVLHRKDDLKTSLEDALQYQGSSIERLEVRIPFDGSRERAFNTSQLELINSTAPRLTHLGINLYRNGSWPYEELAAIASISSLRTVDLYLDLLSSCLRQNDQWRNDQNAPINSTKTLEKITGCHGSDIRRAPMFNVTAAKHLFAYMRERRMGQPLDTLTLLGGEWDVAPSFDDSDRGPRSYFKRYRVVCTATAKDNGDVNCEVEQEGRAETSEGRLVATWVPYHE